MGLTRQEVNLRRLLAKCELMVKHNQKDDTRMPKYVETLEDMLHEIRKVVDTEFVSAYYTRIEALKSNLGITTNKYVYENESEAIRESLLGVRQRNVPGNMNDLDQVINYHEDMQSKITEDMLILTQNLKEQSQLANKIVRKDTEIVTKSSQLSEQNIAKLSTESSKLAEHSRKAWKCWMWIMLLVVVVIFINMVLFMKVMKKK